MSEQLTRLYVALMSRRLRGDAGVTTEVIAWGVVSVGILVAIGAALRQLGVDIVDWIRSQLGLG
jgi:hypothetical protein